MAKNGCNSSEDNWNDGRKVATVVVGRGGESNNFRWTRRRNLNIFIQESEDLAMQAASIEKVAASYEGSDRRK